MTLSSQLFVASPPRRDTHALLEDWPRRSSTVETDPDPDPVDEETDARPKSSSTHRVSFSKTSTLRIYEKDSSVYTKAYSKADQDIFRVDSMLEALRVRELIARSPPTSTKDSVKYLFEKNAIAAENLVGIEHMVLGKHGLASMERKRHSKTVLQKQHELLQQQVQSLEDPAESLACVARRSSFWSTRHAQARAALAAQE